MHIPKMICFPCAVEMVPAKNGLVVEMLMDGRRPYYMVSTDLYRCPRCDHGVTVPAQIALAEHWEPNYGTHTAAIQAEFAP